MTELEGLVQAVAEATWILAGVMLGILVASWCAWRMLRR